MNGNAAKRIIGPGDGGGAVNGRAGAKGNSLIFVLIFLVMLSFLTLPIINIFSYSSQTTAKSKNAMIALNLAAQTIEEIRGMNFSDVGNTPWDNFSGEWVSEASQKITYPEEYKIFQKQIIVKSGKELPVKNDKIKQVVVNVRWDEMTDERKTITHNSIKLATCISKENPND